MSQELHGRVLGELNALRLIDPHSHINPLAPASSSIADILGYHYFTELMHSAGVPKANIESTEHTAESRTKELFRHLPRISNTVQYSWFKEICREFLEFSDEEIVSENWEIIFNRSVQAMSSPDWSKRVLEKSNLSAVFLTNDFDDPLTGFDTSVYIPCLRTDDLVFSLNTPETQRRLELCTKTTVDTPKALRDAIGVIFQHFVDHGAKACAISLPPSFSPVPISYENCAQSFSKVWSGVSEHSDQRTLANFVFWTIAEYCSEYRLPFDLMIGVNRKVFENGVYQGQDLFDNRVSLIQYKTLFNAFPSVKFPVSVLASVSNQELVSYSWIFPNVIAHGHWWYSNIPSYIERDSAARLEAIPRNKQIGYYSDMYKLEFALPKFGMYKSILAKLLADSFVIGRGWSEEEAVALGREVLVGNVRDIFGPF